MADYDALVVGAGHNGLICGAYLAKEGLKTLMLEKSNYVGGCATTAELFPGYKFNLGAHLSVFFQEKVVQDLKLDKYGVEKILLDPQMFVPYPSGRYLAWYGDLDRTCRGIEEQFSKEDAEGFRHYVLFWQKFGQVMGPVFLNPPPSLGQLLGGLTGPEGEEVIRRAMFYSCKESCDELLASEELKAFFGFLAVNGNALGPMTPGTNFICGFHLMIEAPWYYVKGGTGALTGAIAQAFEDSGGTLKTRTPVKKILVKGGKAIGVELEDGQRITADLVISGTDPQMTFLNLVGSENLPADFVRAVQGIKNKPVYCQMFCALSELPDYKCLPGKEPGPQHNPTLIAPSIEYIERAWDDAKYGRASEDPIVFMSIPSVHDPTLAPPGHHSASLYVMYTPYDLAEGNWRELKKKIAERVIDVVTEYAPNFRESVIRHNVWSPLDYEKVFGITKGNFWHADITIDQMFSFRPTPGWSSYRTPVAGLYLCASGTHPGGGLSGAPGHNAAQIILADWKAQVVGEGMDAMQRWVQMAETPPEAPPPPLDRDSERGDEVTDAL